MSTLDPEKGMVKILILPFFQAPDGPDKVFVATCCNRLFVSKKRPTKCRTCGKAPEVREVSRADVGL